MIQIIRGSPTPEILLNKGVPDRDKAIRKYAANKKLFLKRWEADSAIYGAGTVKNTLIAEQYGKCCYCESYVTHVSYGDVEHYRPKGGYRQHDDDDLHCPGYFWLAYEWDNLLFSCEICNQRYKKNLFPLKTPETRVVVPMADLKVEEPLLVNPVSEDPSQFIAYRGDTPHAVGGNERGSASISMLGLTNETLRARRASLLEKLKLLHQLVHHGFAAPLQREASAVIEDACKPQSEYSAAVRAAVSSNFQYV